MSKIKTLDEWIKLYEKKTRLPYENTDKRMVRYFFPERGFAEIGISKDMVIVGQLSGDGLFWKRVAEILAMERGITHLGCFLVREPESYLKFFGAEIEKTEDVGDNLKRYFCKFKDSDKKALISPQGKMKNGNVRWIVTWEI